MKKRRIIVIVACLFVAVAVLLCGGSCYMLGYSLSPDPNRRNVDSMYAVLYERVPDMKPWVDSLKHHGLLRDTFISMPSGEKAHALYVRGDTAKGRTAIVVHGYKDTAVKYLYLGRMYNRDLGFNVLLPDLHAHGLSDGDAIQMGWNDRNDVIKWVEVAERMFRDSVRKSRIVVHGVSMGAATTMCVSGERLPSYVSCFVEDCGYTSVWDEFSVQIKEQFGLSDFPLMYSTSLLCQLCHGWSFGEASPLRQVAKCDRPMLFVHGGGDTFVPTWMVYPLYNAKRGEKRLWVAPRSEHAKAFVDYPAEYCRRVAAFVGEWMGE